MVRWWKLPFISYDEKFINWKTGKFQSFVWENQGMSLKKISKTSNFCHVKVDSGNE